MNHIHLLLNDIQLDFAAFTNFLTRRGAGKNKPPLKIIAVEANSSLNSKRETWNLMQHNVEWNFPSSM